MTNLKFLKAHYFLQGAGGAPLIPSLPIIAKQLGIPGSGIGLILFLVHLFGLWLKPILGMLLCPHISMLWF